MLTPPWRDDALFTTRFSDAKHLPPPCLSPLVERGMLLGAIHRQRHKRLLLVHACAGYGKTVLLGQWHDRVQSSGALSIWVGLDKRDSSPEHFLASLASGLAHASTPMLRGWKPGGTDPRDCVEEFLSCIERNTRETWLMLDDWHEAEGGATGELMDVLLRAMPPNWHVAISSRTRPKIELLMLRARGQLAEVGQENLRFSIEEARSLMADAALSSGVIEELLRCTEGWAMALQLAQLWLGQGGRLEALQSSFLGAIEGMADYVSTKIFGPLPSSFKDFLLDSSICERFTGDLADALRDRSDSEDLIESLRSPNGLLIALDDEQRWYRHHRLLAEFLTREQRRLHKEHVAQLHGRAALWLERRGFIFEAVEHARMSGDQARMVQLVEDAGCVDLCIRNGAPAVRALLDSLPSDMIHQRPRLRAAYTAVNFKLGSIGQAGELLAELQASATTNTPDAVLQRDLLIVQNLRQCFIDESPSAEDLAAQRHTVATFASADWWLKGLMQNVQGRLEMRHGLLHEAVRSLADADQVFEDGGSAQGHFFMLANLAICYLFLGRLRIADDHLSEMQTVLKRQLDGAPSYGGIVHTIGAMLFYERNELAAAGHAAQVALAGLELAEGCFEQYFSSIQVAARVAFTAAGLDAAIGVIERGRRLAQYHSLTRMGRLFDLLQWRMLIDAKEWDAAAQLAERLSIPAPPSFDEGWLEHDLTIPAFCLLMLHDGRAAEAHTLACGMAARCGGVERLPAQIRAYNLQALAAAALDDHEGARAALRAAIELASANGILQPFFEHDGSMLPLLRDLQRAEPYGWRPGHADFLSGLILRVIAAGKAKDHIEHLTGRERDILGLLRDGGSNKIIARALNLTENAVKFHLKNIFRKLRVDNRAMAAQVAHRLDFHAMS